VTDEADVMTVEAAWALYDLHERELWDEYCASPNYQHGHAYMHAERLARKRCEATVQRLRYLREESRATTRR
jgi:hypothetical protein